MCTGENCVSEVESVPSEVVKTYYIHPLTVVAYLVPNWPISVKQVHHRAGDRIQDNLTYSIHHRRSKDGK